MGTFISTEQDGAVAVVTIDNPPMNALASALLDELEAEIDRLDGDEGTRAIVLRGGGERAFVAGADIKEFPALRESASAESGSARGLQKLGHRMDAARTPFVAAIQGYCLGGGLELAMCCDVRVCADDAKLGQPEIKLGLIPGGGGTQRLPRLVGLGRALLLNLGGRLRRRSHRVRMGPRGEGGAARRAAHGGRRDRGGRSPRARRTRLPSSASSHAPPATCRSRRGCAGRRRASAAASRARTGRRA